MVIDGIYLLSVIKTLLHNFLKIVIHILCFCMILRELVTIKEIKGKKNEKQVHLYSPVVLGICFLLGIFGFVLIWLKLVSKQLRFPL